jgi:hypothetical protein
MGLEELAGKLPIASEDRRKVIRQVLTSLVHGSVVGGIAGAARGAIGSDEGSRAQGALRGAAYGIPLGALGGSIGRPLGRAVGADAATLAGKTIGDIEEGGRIGRLLGTSVGGKLGGLVGGAKGVQKAKSKEDRKRAKEASMSNETTPQEEVLFKEVYLPAFMSKCAELGINFPDGESVQDALETTALVKQMSQAQDSNVIKQANASLKAALGVDKMEAAQKHEDLTKQATEVAARDQSIREAVAGILSK